MSPHNPHANQGISATASLLYQRYQLQTCNFPDFSSPIYSAEATSGRPKQTRVQTVVKWQLKAHHTCFHEQETPYFPWNPDVQ
jgi:hypothetical protein